MLYVQDRCCLWFVADAVPNFTLHSRTLQKQMVSTSYDVTGDI